MVSATGTTTRLFARDDVAMARDGDHALVTGTRLSLRVGPFGNGSMTVLERLFGSSAPERELTAEVAGIDGVSAVPAFLLALHHLDAAGVLGRLVVSEGEPLASLVPVADGYRLVAPELAGDRRYRLSRFAFLRRRGNELVLESPLAGAMVLVHAAPVASLVHALAHPRSPHELAGDGVGLSPSGVAGVLELLAGARLVEQEGEDDASSPLGQWEFHDLLFHSRSRLGRSREPYGGTYPFHGLTGPLPATKPPAAGPVTSLPAPGCGLTPAGSLADVLERRRSVRRHGDAPITLEQLGEFLHRVARQRSVVATAHGELSSRPYPGGGAVYELEVYPAVDRCTGLDRGLYHYQPDQHDLRLVSHPAPAFERLLEDARLTMDNVNRPQVLFLLAARFKRVSWKYRSMAYALVLKDVGVLMQTMYLVATDMGLAPCALGGGNSDLFAAATGLDYLEEGSVGEFALGTAADGPPGLEPRALDGP